MAALVMLRSPKGVVKAVDPDSFDVDGALAAGFQRVPEGPTRQVTEDTGPALTQGQTNRDFGRILAHEVLPSLAAAGATMVDPPLGLAGKASPWLLRMGSSFLGGTAGELGTQGLMREPLDPRAALSRGVGEATAQGLGEGLAGIAQHSGEALYKKALKPGIKITKQAVQTQSRLTGGTVAPDVADVSLQGLRERVPVGRLFRMGPSGSEVMTDIVAPHIQAKTEAIRAAEKARWRINPQNLAAGVSELKGELASEVGGQQKAAIVDKLWDEFLNQFRQTTYPSGKPRPGAPKIRRMSASELDDQVMRWQQQADYNADAMDPNEAIRARLAKALARAGRAKLRTIDVHMAGGNRVGDVIAAANDRMSSLHPLQDAIGNAEVRGASGGGSGGSWISHAPIPTAGALVGSAGGPPGVAVGGLLGIAADRALANPAVSSRAGLALTNIRVQDLLRQMPRGVASLLQLHSAPSGTATPTNGARDY